ncbi:LmbU family transcriptional regulator [Amycolatopsis lurida]
MATSRRASADGAKVEGPRNSPTGTTSKSRRPLPGPALTKRTSLSLPPRISLDEWSDIGRHLWVISDASAWWLADWLVYGQSQFPDRYKRAILETSLDYQTLRNYAWVGRKFSSSRRRDKLSFQHHAELASLSDADQDEWLDRAERFGWSRNELRNRVKASRSADKRSAEIIKLQMNIVADRKQRWSEAASASDQDLVSWMVSILDHAASTQLPPDDSQLAQP